MYYFIKCIFYLLLLGMSLIPSQIQAAQSEIVIDDVALLTFLNASSLDSLQNELGDSIIVEKVKFKRGKAILFTLFTGLLGGHRIYLGTHQRVPIIYSITLGGFGILPIIDLVNIIFTKDLSKFEDNPHVIMWGK